MQNNILVINCGSSSLKFSLMNPINGQVILSGLAECLLSPDAVITIKHYDKKEKSPLNSPFDHQVAINFLVSYLAEHQLKESVYAIGHRVVHGGEQYSQPTLINVDVKRSIDQLAKLAPLHNPANLQGINAAEQAFNNIPQVAIFDTAFHQTMPEKAYIYGLPYQFYQEHGIRKYGFHGTSHYFVSKEAAKIINKPIEQCNFISAHLGNGCSVTAIKQGCSVDTSLGLTPLEGVMMGTRSGDVDPGVIFHLVEQLGYTLDEVNTILNKQSGLLGVSQLSNDCRTIEEAAEKGDKQAILAIAIFSYRIAKSIASFSCNFSSLDGLIFTGGIGENSILIRSQILSQLTLLNFKQDEKANANMRFGKQGNIAKASSSPCWVIPTNEEWVIAEQTFQLLEQEL